MRQNQAVTGRDYVAAIRKLLRINGMESIHFDPATYDDPDRDLPFIDWGCCRHDRLDTVWLPKDSEGGYGIGLTGTRDDIQPGVFYGDEKEEDFEAIFRAVYDEIFDMTDIGMPCGRWLKEFLDHRWQFVYDEEDGRDGAFFGVISDGSRFLFFRTVPLEGPDLIRVFHSIRMEEDSLVCEYPRTVRNDGLLIGCLNDLDDPEDYCGDDSPVGFIRFEDGSEG